MDRIETSRADAERLQAQSLSEVTPSRRDLSQAIAGSKDAPELIARVTATADSTTESLVDYAQTCDDAEVAALSVSLFGGVSPEQLAAISAATTAPILREDPLVDAKQLYHSRLHGIDAVVLPAKGLPADDIERLVDIAVSMHMSVVIECVEDADVEIALHRPYTILGLRAVHQDVPANRTALLLTDIATRDEYDRAEGHCDAVIVAPRAFSLLRADG